MAGFTRVSRRNVGLRVLGRQKSSADRKAAVMAAEAGAAYNCVIKLCVFPTQRRMAARAISSAVEHHVIVGQSRRSHAIMAAVATR